MDQLTLGDILDFAARLRRKGMSIEELRNLPIYLGDDDELNGIHCGWFANIVDASDTKDEDNMYIIEMINENSGNYKLEKGKAILIS